MLHAGLNLAGNVVEGINDDVIQPVEELILGYPVGFGSETSNPPFIYDVPWYALWQYSDEYSGSKYNITGWKAAKAVYTDRALVLYQCLGQKPVTSHSGDPPEINALLFRNKADTVAVGSGKEWWTQVWNDSGSGKSSDYTVWKIRDEKIPHGYYSLSPCFFKKGNESERQPPSDQDVDRVVLVKEDYVSFVTADKVVFVWSDAGTKANSNCSIYTGPDGVGTFAFPTHNSPSGSFPVLNWSLGEKLDPKKFPQSRDFK